MKIQRVEREKQIFHLSFFIIFHFKNNFKFFIAELATGTASLA